MATMRDVFFSTVFEYAKKDSGIVVLTSDFSAPSFDRYRLELPAQMINTGISEQNTLLLAAGLALEGKKVFVTSIAPFITMRCFEQTRLYAADMNLDITLVGVGAGFSYNTAGPTHHSVEDIALMRVLPNMRVLSPCSGSQVAAFARQCCERGGPAYVRLDRMVFNELYPDGFDGKTPETAGFSILREPGDITLVATGCMTHTALRVADVQPKGRPAGVLDLYRIPLDAAAFLSAVAGVKRLVTLEEHVAPGGMGAYLCELLADHERALPVRRFALDCSKNLYHGYGTREEMQEACGIGAEKIKDYLKEWNHE